MGVDAATGVQEAGMLHALDHPKYGAYEGSFRPHGLGSDGVEAGVPEPRALPDAKIT